MACKTFIILIFVVVLVGGAGATVVDIAPPKETIQNGEQIYIPIRCTPSEPVAAIECIITYDPTVLSVENVSEGDFFQELDTFFSPTCSIDQTNGTITDIYILRLGPENMNQSGDVFILNVTGASQIGSTTIAFDMIGVTNDSTYIPHTTSNALITVYNTTYPRWDINQDAQVDAADISLLVSHYGETIDDPETELWDVIIDGQCNAQDISLVISKYGE